MAVAQPAHHHLFSILIPPPLGMSTTSIRPPEPPTRTHSGSSPSNTHSRPNAAHHTNAPHAISTTQSRQIASTQHRLPLCPFLRPCPRLHIVFAARPNEEVSERLSTPPATIGTTLLNKFTRTPKPSRDDDSKTPSLVGIVHNR